MENGYNHSPFFITHIHILVNQVHNFNPFTLRYDFDGFLCQSYVFDDALCQKTTLTKNYVNRHLSRDINVSIYLINIMGSSLASLFAYFVRYFSESRTYSVTHLLG